MCGIFGSPAFTDDVRGMLPFLALKMEERGKHAWGASNGVDIIKHLGPIHSTWGKEKATIGAWEAGIFHTRYASQGASDKVENAHPFEATKPDGTHLIGIHNGGVTNHYDINRTHNRSCSVDSEHIWLHRAEGLPWDEFRGYANLAWWEVTPNVLPAKLFLTRINSDALIVARVADGGIVFASSLVAIMLAASMAGTSMETTYSITSGRVYRLEAGHVWDTEEEVKFGAPPTQNLVDGTSWHGGSHNYSSPANRTYPVYTSKTSDSSCVKCHSYLLDPAHLICRACIAGFRDELKILLKEEEEAVLAEFATGDSTSTELTEDEMAEMERLAYGAY